MTDLPLMFERIKSSCSTKPRTYTRDIWTGTTARFNHDAAHAYLHRRRRIPLWQVYTMWGAGTRPSCSSTRTLKCRPRHKAFHPYSGKECIAHIATPTSSSRRTSRAGSIRGTGQIGCHSSLPEDETRNDHNPYSDRLRWVMRT